MYRISGRIAFLAYILGGMLLPFAHSHSHTFADSHHADAVALRTASHCECSAVDTEPCDMQGISVISCQSKGVDEPQPAGCDDLCTICVFLTSGHSVFGIDEVWVRGRIVCRTTLAQTQTILSLCDLSPAAPRGPPLV